MFNRYPALISLLFLIPAIIGGLPYDFYTLLRVVISISSVYYGFVLKERGHIGLSIAFFANAVVFNPLVPLHLGRETWLVVDALNLVLFIYMLVLKRR